MSKKIKPVMESDSQATEDDSQTVAERFSQQQPVVGGDFNSKVQYELEKIEKLEQENLRLTNENAALKSQLADYIDRLEKLELQLKAGKPSSEEKQLQEENDKYLMKISELTFENAKLTAAMQNQKSALSQQAQKTAPAKSQYHNVYRNSNGYSSWN